MGKQSRSKQTAVNDENLRSMGVLFTFDVTDPKHSEVLQQLLKTLRQPIYSSQVELITSEETKQTKIVCWGNIVQMNNLEGFFRGVDGLKMLNERTPADEMAALIKQYHHNLWNELEYPHEEMRLSALVNGIAMRLAILDCPDFRAQQTLWPLAQECYNALETTGFFESLESYREMVRYCFVSGYVAEQGIYERDGMEATVKFKAEILIMEEKGRPDILIHSVVEQVRDRLIKTGFRNTMELLEKLAPPERR